MTQTGAVRRSNDSGGRDREVWLNPGMKRTIAVATLAVAALALGACSSSPSERETIQNAAKANGMSDEQFLACEDFVKGKDDFSAEDAQARADFAREVNEWAQKGGDDLKSAGDSLARTASGPTQAWEMSTGLFEQTCLRLGWPSQADLDAAK